MDITIHSSFPPHNDHSRLLLASTARAVFKGPDVEASYRELAAQYGDPASVLSDNDAV